MWASVARALSASDFDVVLRDTQTIITSAPDDVDAHRVAAFARLQLGDDIDAALASLQRALQKLPQDDSLHLQHAYALYRLRRIDEALAALNSLNVSVRSSLPALHLRAQLLYRQEHFTEAVDQYATLLERERDTEHREHTTTNLLAAIAAAGSTLASSSSSSSKSALAVLSATPTHYEQAYNLACALLARGDLTAAEKYLDVAEQLCRADFAAARSEAGDASASGASDPAAEADLDHELAAIRVQRAYVLLSRGQNAAALELCSSVLKRKPRDGGVLAVASNNAAALNRDRDLFDSHKRLRTAVTSGEQRLARSHRAVVHANLALCLHRMRQNAEAQETLASANKLFADVECTQLELVNVVMGGDSASGDQSSPSSSSGSNLRSVAALLASAQRALQRSDTAEALRILTGAPPALRFRLGVVGTCVALYVAQKQADEARAVLEQAISHYSAQTPPARDTLVLLLRELGDHCRRYGQHQAAVSAYQRLLELSPQDENVLASLVQVLVLVDPAAAAAALRRLPGDVAAGKHIERLPATAVDALEGGRTLATSTTATTDAGAAAAAATTPSASAAPSRKDQQKKKKKKRVRLPKRYDPNVPPDPERWLPRRERSYMKKRQAKKNKAINLRGPQGETSSDSAPPGSSDASRKPAAATAAAAAAAVSPAAAPKGKGAAPQQPSAAAGGGKQAAASPQAKQPAAGAQAKQPAAGAPPANQPAAAAAATAPAPTSVPASRPRNKKRR